MTPLSYNAGDKYNEKGSPAPSASVETMPSTITINSPPEPPKPPTVIVISARSLALLLKITCDELLEVSTCPVVGKLAEYVAAVLSSSLQRWFSAVSRTARTGSKPSMPTTVTLYVLPGRC